MQQAMFTPSLGALVRDPLTLKQVDAVGELKPMTSYWLRRVHDGSGTFSAVAPKAEAAPAPEAQLESKRSRKNEADKQ